MLDELGEPYLEAAALTNLGRLYTSQRRWEQTEAAYGRALELYLSAGRRGPETALCRNGLGVAAFETGRPHLGVELLEAALREYGDDPRQAAERALTPANLGRAVFAIGETDRADHLLRRALALQESALGSEHPDVAVTLGYLAEAMKAQGLKKQSRVFIKRAESIQALRDETNAAGATVDAGVWLNRGR